MSIISDALSGRTTWSTAANQIAGWFARIAGPAASADVLQKSGALMSDLKQAASDAVSLSETLMGPLLSAGALAVEAAADTALKAAIGPAASMLTPAIDTAISDVETQLIAAIRTRSAAIRASLSPTAGTAQPPAGG